MPERKRERRILALLVQEDTQRKAAREQQSDTGACFRIEQIGTPAEIYDRPATPFVYEFLGSANRLPCHVQAGRIDVAGGWFELPFGIWRVRPVENV